MARLGLRLPAAVKRVTNPLLGRVSIRIASGANKGLRWSLATAGSGYGSGRRERAQMPARWRIWIHVGDALLKVAVEGAEADLLSRGIRALDPTTLLVLPIHSAELNEACARL